MSGMFSKPKVPKPVEPKVVPMVDEDALAKTKRRSMVKQRARRGRASTMLTERDTLG